MLTPEEQELRTRLREKYRFVRKALGNIAGVLSKKTGQHFISGNFDPEASLTEDFDLYHYDVPHLYVASWKKKGLGILMQKAHLFLYGHEYDQDSLEKVVIVHNANFKDDDATIEVFVTENPEIRNVVENIFAIHSQEQKSPYAIMFESPVYKYIFDQKRLENAAGQE
jgi:hypothetical protein